MLHINMINVIMHLKSYIEDLMQKKELEQNKETVNEYSQVLKTIQLTERRWNETRESVI